VSDQDASHKRGISKQVRLLRMSSDVWLHGKFQRTYRIGSQAEDGWEIGNSFMLCKPSRETSLISKSLWFYCSGCDYCLNKHILKVKGSYTLKYKFEWRVNAIVKKIVNPLKHFLQKYHFKIKPSFESSVPKLVRRGLATSTRESPVQLNLT